MSEGTEDLEVGKIYTGKVVSISSLGAFVEIVPGRDGFVQLSELADHPITKVEDVADIGDELTVKVIDVDEGGRISLSRL